MDWRPKDWDNPYHIFRKSDLTKIRHSQLRAFEAGADAILESLKKQGIYGKVGGDYECFCLFPADATYSDPGGAYSMAGDEEIRKEIDKWKYPDDITDCKGKGWLVWVPEEKK